MMTELMQKKNDLVRITLTQDPDSLKDTLKMQKEWLRSQESREQTTTQGVRMKILKRFLLSPFGDILGEPIKIDIIPIGFNNMCHKNCENFCKISDDYTQQTGYNITACKCGNLMCMEVHTVLKDKEGKMFDITPDFNKETQKWFVPINFDKKYRFMLQFVGRKFDYHIKGKNRCKCGVTWSSNMPNFEPEELVGFVKQMGRVVVWEL
jgi:hypothetical protein